MWNAYHAQKIMLVFTPNIKTQIWRRTAEDDI